MIKLAKTQIPDILARKSPEWTRAIVDKLARGETPTKSEKTRYNHEDIKAALINETNGKCAYCESKMRHVAPGDIEHIVPKSKKPERAFEWDNLTLACTECNRRKDDLGVDDGIKLVDPYVMDPKDHIRFAGDLALASPGSDPGLLTEKILELNRPDLLDRRRERILNLQKILEIIARTQDTATQKILIQDAIDNETLPSQEYAAASREFLNVMLRV